MHAHVGGWPVLTGARAPRRPVQVVASGLDSPRHLAFGAHTYRRLDRAGVFHTRWAQDGVEVRTD